MKNCRNGAYSGRTLIPWNFSKGSSHNAAVVLSKIRCIKDKHHMQSKYVTWYGIIILCLWSPSPKYCHDLHRHRHDTMISIILISINVSSHGRLANYCLLQLLLSHSDKVKQLYGACILCNKKTTIRLLQVAENFNKTWSSHTIKFSIMSWQYHITTCPAKTS